MRRSLGVLAAVAAVAAFGPVASASASNAFDGLCTISGTATFSQGLGVAPGARGFTFDGTGTCDGSMNGTPSRRYTIRAIVGNSNALLGCAASFSQDGSGGVRFFNTNTSDPADDIIISGNLDEVSVGTEVPIKLDGAESGSAVGEATFSSQASPAVVNACAAGTMRSIAFSARFGTVPGLPVSG